VINKAWTGEHSTATDNRTCTAKSRPTREPPYKFWPYLKKLPDFDDVEAEDRAMALALGFGMFEVALAFLKEWPDQNRAVYPREAAE
jgi:hypothetical protein